MVLRLLGGAPSIPFTVRNCRISQFCAATCCLLLPPYFTPILMPGLPLSSSLCHLVSAHSSIIPSYSPWTPLPFLSSSALLTSISSLDVGVLFVVFLAYFLPCSSSQLRFFFWDLCLFLRGFSSAISYASSA